MDTLELKVRLSEALKAKWDTAYINDLPDSAFFYICPGGKKDEEGKTVPRDLRKLPYKDADGKVDIAHVRNALARLNQVKCGDEKLSQATQDRLRKRIEAVLENAKKAEKMAGLSRQVYAVEEAFYKQFGATSPESGVYPYSVIEVLDGYAIVDSWDEYAWGVGLFDIVYRVSYTIDAENNVTFAPKEEWIRGTYQFVPLPVEQ